MMKNDKLSKASLDFAVAVHSVCKTLKENREFIISDQIFRSASSIGANIREAQYAASRADFVNKLRISLKEANETDYWLELLLRTEYITQELYTDLENQCKELRLLLIRSIKTAESNQ